MKSILPEAFEDRVKIGRRRYTLRPTAGNVLRATEALKDEALTETDRARLAVWFLYRWPRPRDLQKAVKAAFELLDEENPYLPDKGAKQGLSLKQDAAMIYAAFWQLYGLDLREEIDRLDWRAFLALLGGVTGDTRLGEIEGIRTQDVPKWTPHNGEHRRQIMRLKQIYAIKDPERRGQSFQEGLRNMAEMLIAMAGEAVEVSPETPETPDTKAGEQNGGA